MPSMSARQTGRGEHAPGAEGERGEAARAAAWLAAEMARLGLGADPGTHRRLVAYGARIAAGAPRAGLTSVRDPIGIARRHLGESLALLAALRGAELLPAGRTGAPRRRRQRRRPPGDPDAHRGTRSPPRRDRVERAPVRLPPGELRLARHRGGRRGVRPGGGGRARSRAAGALRRRGRAGRRAARGPGGVCPAPSRPRRAARGAEGQPGTGGDGGGAPGDRHARGARHSTRCRCRSRPARPPSSCSS